MPAKIMFEIYREASYNRRYRVVYFTELDDHNKESEINRALAGDHVFDGYLREGNKEEAKDVIDRALVRLNSGDDLNAEEIEKELAPFLDF
jgi:hypothetical protein